MPFPYSAEGRVIVPAKGRGSLGILAAIEADLRAAKASELRRDADTIIFKNRLFRPVIVMDDLGAITHGKITVVQTGDHVLIQYTISFQLLVVATIAFSTFMLGAFALSSNFQAATVGTVMPWLIYVVNYTADSFSFPQFLRLAAVRSYRLADA